MLEPEQVSSPARITTFLSPKHKVISAVRTKPLLIGRSAAAASAEGKVMSAVRTKLLLIGRLAAAALAGSTGSTPTVLSMAAGVVMRVGVAGGTSGESSLWSRVW